MKHRLIGIILGVWSVLFLFRIGNLTDTPTNGDLVLFSFFLLVEIGLIVGWVRCMNKYHSPQNAEYSTPTSISRNNATKDLSEAEITESKSNKEKRNQPFYTLWWFWALIVLCLFGFLTNAPIMGEEDKTPDKDKGNTDAETIETISRQPGSEGNPYVLTATEWYSAHRGGEASQKYIGQWVKISGTVLSISDYGTLKGYYLCGGPGSGLVCWVNDESVSVKYGQQIEYIGKVTVEDSKQIELSNGRIQSVAWPTEKARSPITISEWTWTRNSAGGVEWSFKFTNNTDKTVKYITMEWDCYNAVGDLVYDEISQKPNHGVKFTGPLESGGTSELMCTSTLFYNYSYYTSKLTKLTAEFMDGTIICINNEAYFDILQ